jgi:hypothetical protein
MPTFIQRLDLVSGKSLQVEQKWFESDEHPVGLIDDDDDGGCDVWLLPIPLRDTMLEFYFKLHTAISNGYSVEKSSTDRIKQQLSATKNVICRHVPASQVAFTEEIVGMQDAYVILHSFFADKIGLPDDDDEEAEDEPESDAAPQLTPATNGPAGARPE